MKKYFIISSDDCSTQDLRLAGLLTKHGIKGTFFLNSGLFGNEYKMSVTDAKELFKNTEHYAGGHTLTHSVLSITDPKEFEHQILTDKLNIEKMLEREIDMFSYPGNADPIEIWSEEAEKYLKSIGYVASRHIHLKDDFKGPKNPLRWLSNGHIKWANEKSGEFTWEHDAEPFATLEKFMNQKDGNLLHLWTHAWEWNEWDWKSADEFFHLLSKTDIESISYSEYLKLNK